VRGRVQLTNGDRLFFIQLYRWFPSVLKSITIVRPETLVRSVSPYSDNRRLDRSQDEAAQSNAPAATGNSGVEAFESRGLPGASARERFKELVLNALVAEKLALKEIAHEPENTSIAEPAAEPAAAPDDADGVLVDWVPAALVESTSTANNELPRHQLTPATGGRRVTPSKPSKPVSR